MSDVGMCIFTHIHKYNLRYFFLAFPHLTAIQNVPNFIAFAIPIVEQVFSEQRLQN